MERFDTIIVGGGQAGLVTGRFLAPQGRSLLILDAHERVGDAWRTRWDSLRVFTPAKYDGLPGMRFPAPRLSFPTKDEVADYMEAYARRFDLPVRNGVRAERIERGSDGFVLTTNSGEFQATNVVIATGAHQTPKVPPFASQLNTRIEQLHSSMYRNPGQLREGAVLVVGLGNSGAEISMDVRHGRHVFISGSPFAQIPVKHGAAAALFVLPLIKFMGTYLLNMDTPMGRKVLPKMKTAPLIRVKVEDLVAAGIERVPRVAGVRDGMPLLEDGRTLDVANVIWCTGFTNDLSWIKVPEAFDADGRPAQYRGVATAVPGLYFVGMQFQYAATSDVLPGVGRDAAYVARRLAGSPRSDGLDPKDRVVRRDTAELGVG
jgi:putative flavoprotein involved in K+ transport